MSLVDPREVVATLLSDFQLWQRLTGAASEDYRATAAAFIASHEAGVTARIGEITAAESVRLLQEADDVNDAAAEAAFLKPIR